MVDVASHWRLVLPSSSSCSSSLDLSLSITSRRLNSSPSHSSSSSLRRKLHLISLIFSLLLILFLFNLFPLLLRIRLRHLFFLGLIYFSALKSKILHDPDLTSGSISPDQFHSRVVKVGAFENLSICPT